MVIRRSAFRGCVAVIALFIIAVAAVSPLSAQSAIESNGRRILELSLQKLNTSRVIDTLSIPVYLSGNLCDAYRYDVTNFFLSNHKQVSSQSSNNSRLSLQVTTSNQYQEVGNNKAVRRINGELTVTLTDTTGLIKSMEHYTLASTDTVSAGMRDRLQSDWRPSQFMDSKKKRSWVVRRILEPGLLLGAVGVSIYLLFNVRGN